jgi:heme exporter protein D
MAAPLQPEFFLLLGIDLFLAMSLLSCLLDKHFPWHLPYLYQVASLAGFGQLIVAREFMAVFGDYMRFWFSLLYVAIALANIAAINVYLGVIKKMLNYAKVFMLAVSFPSFAVVSFFLADYSSLASHPLIMFPNVAWETTFVGIVAFDTFVIGAGTYLFFKPKWWHVALVGGAAITGATAYALFKPMGGTSVFVVSAVALALACIFVLAVSVYILVRIWKETKTEKDRKRR